MKAPVLQLVGAIALVAANTAWSQPRPELYIGEPSPELLSDLQKQFQSAPNASALDKARRVDLAARIIQVDLLLGDRGSKKYANLRSTPDEAAAALAALQKLTPTVLNDIRIPETRRTIWNAIAAAHPAYRIYVEAVRLAGYEEDRDIIEKTLRPLLSSWTRGNNLRPLSEVRDPIGQWGREVLCDCLRMQTIRGPEDAIKVGGDVKTVLESSTKRARKVGDPPAMSTRPFPLLRASGRIAPFDLAVHQACGLQRAGFDVTFWSLAATRTIDAETKTIAQEPLIVLADKLDKSMTLAIGSEEVLETIGGQKVAVGLRRIQRNSLDEYIARHGQFWVPMSEVLEASSSPLAWAKGMQQILSTKRGAGTPRELLLELAALDSCGAFNAIAIESFATTPQSAFIRTLQTESIRLTVTLVKDKKADQPVAVDDFGKRQKELTLLKHEAAMGRAFQVLPAKVLKGVQTIQLQSEPLNEKRNVSVQVGTRSVIKEVDSPLPGRGWSNRLMMAAPIYQLGVHELFHCWAFNRAEVFTIGDWRGTVINAFNEINWEPVKDGPGVTVRGGTGRTDDFATPYGATNQNEDLAVTAEYYVLQPRVLRAQVRAQLKRGNLMLPAKYLFIKYVCFLDRDGKCIEYETDPTDLPFTKDEFDKGVRIFEDRKTINEEQKRLRDLATRILTLSKEMIQSKRIVRNEPKEPIRRTRAHQSLPAL